LRSAINHLYASFTKWLIKISNLLSVPFYSAISNLYEFIHVFGKMYPPKGPRSIERGPFCQTPNPNLTAPHIPYHIHVCALERHLSYAPMGAPGRPVEQPM